MKFPISYIIVGLVLVLVVIFFSPLMTSEQQSPEIEYLVPPSDLVSGGPPKDGIPSIDNPKFTSIEEIEGWLEDDDEVYGINIGETSRAYPVKILVWHEIVNDEIEGFPFIVTYCPLCNTGVAFDRRVDGRTLEFGVSGKLYNSNLVMFDRQTDSYWPQAEGKAIIGELTGKELTQIPMSITTWKEWKEQFPDSEILSRSTGYIRDYNRNPYINYFEGDQILFPVENIDPRLESKVIVYGIEIDRQFKAYPEEIIKENNHLIDSFAGKTIDITYSSEGTKFTNSETGEEILSLRGFWFAWVAFHPETELYSEVG